MRTIGAGWRKSTGTRARFLQPSGLRLESGMDCHLGAAVRVPGLRPHDEPFAGLAAPMAVVCGSSNPGSALPAFDSGGDGAIDRRPVRA